MLTRFTKSIIMPIKVSMILLVSWKRIKRKSLTTVWIRKWNKKRAKTSSKNETIFEIIDNRDQGSKSTKKKETKKKKSDEIQKHYGLK